LTDVQTRPDLDEAGERERLTKVLRRLDADTYATAMDKSMLYIACTRAMHELHLSDVGEPTEFLASAMEGAL